MSVLDRVTQREVLAEHDGRSGARLERGVLDDGTKVIVKTASPSNDITIAATGGIDRERVLWETGAFDRLTGELTHPILDIVKRGDDTITVMRDVGDAIPGWTRVLTHAECDRVMRALGWMHAAFLDDAPDAACALETRLGVLAPGTVERFASPDNPLVGAIATGWERFFELVTGDVAEAVAAVHADPAGLAEAMRRCGPTTLTHADLWLVNLALEADTVVLLDWALATNAPPALDLAVFLTGSAAHVEPTREEIITRFCAHSPSTTDDAVALALLFGLADMGWNKALDATEHDDPAMRERERKDLEWWTARAAGTLARGLL